MALDPAADVCYNVVMPNTAATPTHYLLAVANGEPILVRAYEDWTEAVNAQEKLTDFVRAKGIKPAELWYCVRPIDDVQGLVKRALESAAKSAAKSAEKPQATLESAEKPQATPKAKRVPTRTVEGVKLVSQGERYWLSEDGKWEIGYMDDYETECDAPHPVKVSKLNREWYARLNNIEKAHVQPVELRLALQDGKRGYFCYGGETHYYALWHVANTQTDKVIGRGDTFGDALDMLAKHLRTGKTWD